MILFFDSLQKSINCKSRGYVMSRAVIGGGCFWCVEAAYKNMRGIKSALPGYAGVMMKTQITTLFAAGLQGTLRLWRYCLMKT